MRLLYNDTMGLLYNDTMRLLYNDTMRLLYNDIMRLLYNDTITKYVIISNSFLIILNHYQATLNYFATYGKVSQLNEIFITLYSHFPLFFFIFHFL